MSQMTPKSDWKARAFALGGVAGIVFGLVAAYFYTRAAEDDARRNGNRANRVSTGELIGLGLAGLAMIRQITEMGRSPDQKRR